MRATMGLAMAVLLTISGCDIAARGVPTIKGSGISKEEKREVEPFTGVDISATFEATVSIGPKASVTLIVDDNLLPLVTTVVRDGRLIVGYEQGVTVSSVKPPKVTIVVPALDSVTARGASKLFATGGESSTLKIVAEGASIVTVGSYVADSVDVKADGASKVTLSGKGKRLVLDASGASKVASDAAFESARVGLDGAVYCEIMVTGSIDGTASGASVLKVKGDPKTRAVKTSGASSVAD